MACFFELYEGLPRGGPGSNAVTERAYRLVDVKAPRILDIGCGPGMQSLHLARISGGEVVAIDNHQPFLDALAREAAAAGLRDRVSPVNVSMLEMDFEPGSFDVVWSEGAIYFMGFGNGVKRGRELVRDGGYLAYSEAVYFVDDPPKEVLDFWEGEYDDMGTVDQKIRVIEEAGVELVGHFPLPVSAWLDHFYDPMDRKIQSMREEYSGNEVALRVLEQAARESRFFRENHAYYGYEFFVMRK
ncbi:MAG: class I SAM-dependent methyltransferase [Planctomycetota bacterium]